MKMTCQCGALLVDATDYLPHKAHFIPDQRYETVLKRIEALIESCPSTPTLLESAYNRLLSVIRDESGTVIQCRACGRLHVQDEQHTFHSFMPDSPATSTDIFARDRFAD